MRKPTTPNYGRYGTAGVTSILSIMALCWVQAELGAFAEGIAHGQQAARIAEARDDKLSLMFADVGVGHLYLVQGDLAHAIPRLERGLAICRTWDFPSWLPWLASRVGAAYVLAGRVAEGLPLLEQAVEQAAAMGWKVDGAGLATRLGEGYLAAGRTQDAGVEAARALELAVAHKGRGHQAWALRLLGAVAARRAESEQAGDYYRQARALATELGMRPLLAHCEAGLGHVETAAAMYREMEMSFGAMT